MYHLHAVAIQKRVSCLVSRGAQTSDVVEHSSCARADNRLANLAYESFGLLRPKRDE